MKIKIEIVETNAKVVEVDCATIEDALDLVANQYENGEIDMQEGDTWEDYDVNVVEVER